jgi:hypothetical protein
MSFDCLSTERKATIDPERIADGRRGLSRSFEVAHFCAAGAFRGGLGWPTEMFAVVVFG